MKKIIYSLFFAGLILFSACSDEDKIVVNPDPKSPELQIPANGDNIIIEESSASNKITFKWSDADYGVATQVTYTIEADEEDGDFSEPIKIGETIDSHFRITAEQLNLKLAKNFNTSEPVSVSFRIRASLEDVTANDALQVKVESLISKVVTAKLSLYKLKNANDDGTRIYIVGAAVPAGWTPGNAVEMENIGPNIYRATTTFGVDRFRFLAQKDWGPTSYNFPFFTGTVNSNFENAKQPDRGDDDENLWFKGAPSEYTITVDLNTKSIVLDATHTDDDSRIYIVGAGVPEAGWDPGKAVEMVNIAPDVYQAITDFDVDRFRFLAQKDWGPTSYNFPFFSGGGVSANLENAKQPDRGDDDENLWFKGTEGKHIMTVDLANKTAIIY